MNVESFDHLARALALAKPEEKKKLAEEIASESRKLGVFPAAIGDVYRALGKGELPEMTTPAFNIRGLTYALARVIWKKVLDCKSGPIIFELAPSESWAGDQSYAEYAAMILAAACREGYRGPVFLQGDHFAIESREDVPETIKRAREVITCGFYQIDIDGSHLIVEKPADLSAFHKPNAEVTAQIITELRKVQPEGISLVLGGEVGEIGGRDTSVEDLVVYKHLLESNLAVEIPGLDKISAQTGTAHGGVVLQDGSTGRMNVNFDLITKLSRQAREYHWSGIVQHGASTLTMEDLGKLPQAGVIEVHLATQIQNIVFDHPAFPTALREQMQKRLLVSNQGAEGEQIDHIESMSLAQQFYKARWTAWGTFKQEMWALPNSVMGPIEISFGKWVEDIIKVLHVDQKDWIIKQYFKGA